MQVERIAAVLRPRSPWEAMELGTAMVRRHAAAIWKPWLLLTLPVFLLVNLVAFALEKPLLASVFMWWLKPLFDRIPLYVLSRAVFGEVPTPAATLRAQRSWGLPRPVLDLLTWRRLSPYRALMLPIDMLEGGESGQQRQRRSVISGRASGHASALTLVCMHFEGILQLAPLALVFLFVPPEMLPDTWAGFRQTFFSSGETPGIALLWNTLAWFACSVIEPFYIGAGFGLYLNRRTELEAWDVEIALRRMRARLQKLAAGGVAVLVLALACAPTLQAQPINPRNAVQPSGAAAVPPKPIEQSMGEVQPAQHDLQRAMGKLVDDPELHPRKLVSRWERRDPPAPPKERPRSQTPSWLGAFGQMIGSMGQAIAWGIVLLVAGFLLWWLVRNWPALRGARDDIDADAVVIAEAALPQTLPADIPSAVRRLWSAGEQRQALALLYRGAVEAMVARTQVLLVPGATEAECLRASQQLNDEGDRTLFRQLVRTWQYAAYAHEVPSSEDFETLLGGLSRSFGWAR